MKEAKEQSAWLKEDDVDTFTWFLEFVYKGHYESAPHIKKDSELPAVRCATWPAFLPLSKAEAKEIWWFERPTHFPHNGKPIYPFSRPNSSPCEI